MADWLKRQWDDIKGNVKYALLLIVLGVIVTGAAVLVDGLPRWKAAILVILFVLLSFWAAIATWSRRSKDRRTAELPDAGRTPDHNSGLSIRAVAEEQPDSTTLAGRLFELATRYKKAAREFHRQNPQPPAPPALTTWATKANGWQKINFLPELQRAHDELEAEGLSDTLLDVAIGSTPTLDRVEQITQRLRFLAAQLDDDPSDYQNARVPEIVKNAPFPTKISLLLEEVEYNGALGCPLKLRFHLRNDSPGPIDVQFQDYRPKSITLRQVVADIFQLRFGGAWVPQPDGVGQIAVFPNQQFRGWIAADERRFNKGQVQEHCGGNAGTLVLLVNGQKYEIQL